MALIIKLFVCTLPVNNSLYYESKGIKNLLPNKFSKTKFFLIIRDNNVSLINICFSIITIKCFWKSKIQMFVQFVVCWILVKPAFFIVIISHTKSENTEYFQRIFRKKTYFKINKNTARENNIKFELFRFKIISYYEHT